MPKAFAGCSRYRAIWRGDGRYQATIDFSAIPVIRAGNENGAGDGEFVCVADIAAGRCASLGASVACGCG